MQGCADQDGVSEGHSSFKMIFLLGVIIYLSIEKNHSIILTSYDTTMYQKKEAFNISHEVCN